VSLSNDSLKCNWVPASFCSVFGSPVEYAFEAERQEEVTRKAAFTAKTTQHKEFLAIPSRSEAESKTISCSDSSIPLEKQKRNQDLPEVHLLVLIF